MKYRDLISSIDIKPSKYRKWRIEKDFQTDIFTALRKLNWICFHPDDVWLSNKFLDWITVSPEWDTVYLEFKKIDLYTFNLSQFEPWQIVLLTKMWMRKNAEAYVPIFSKAKWEYKIFTFQELKDMANDKWGCKIFNK